MPRSRWRSEEQARAALASLTAIGDHRVPDELGVALARAHAWVGNEAEATRALAGAQRGCDGLALRSLEAKRRARLGFR